MIVALTHFESGCRNCGNEVTGRSKFYCSSDCREIWYENHDWRWASKAVWRRLRGQVHCELCGDMSPSVEVGQFGHRFEIDHIEPMRGANRGRANCLNHQDNLRLLCIPCHRKVTREQFSIIKGEEQ